MAVSDNFKVQTHARNISFDVKPDEAQAAFAWFRGVNEVLKKVQMGVAVDDIQKDMPIAVPMIVNELVGGFSAVAENRGYGGH